MLKRVIEQERVKHYWLSQIFMLCVELDLPKELIDLRKLAVPP